MTPAESTYLDLVRFIAAVLVVITHFLQNALLPVEWSGVVPDLGREAVVVFFVLSGYVIAYASDTKYARLADYLASRASRLYSVALPVLLIAFAVDSIAMNLIGTEYPHSYQYEKYYFYIPFHLLFLGEVWTIAERPFTADPYWSLSYEAWYYVWFATLFYFNGWRRPLLFIAVALIVGYQHWILFPIWLSGVALYRYRDVIVMKVNAARIGMMMSLVVILALEYSGGDLWLWRLGRDSWPFDGWPQGSTDQYLLDYVVAGSAIIHLYCARYAALEFLLPRATIIRNLAAYTFSLYLIHTVVIFNWIYNFSFDRENWIHIVSMCSLIVIATYSVAQISEKRREYFHRPCMACITSLGAVMNRLPGIRGFSPPPR